MEGTTTTSYCKNRRPPTYGNLITILSIDGGGVKELISEVILANLESQLQELDGMEARLVDYFDVIAGTSSAGLSTALLTAPNNDQRPFFAAKDLVSFSLDTSPKNFPPNKDDTLTGKQSIADLSTMENLKYLIQVGENLLKKPVSRINMDTVRYEPVVNGGTNEEALKKFAKLLSDEKKFRESKYTDMTRSE